MNQRALIIDDEPDIRELLEITLGRMDIDTVAAQDIGSAKDLLAKEQFDLCLTDMHLPDGLGIELVQLINEQYRDLPVAVITAFGSMETAIDALKAGAFDFVQKPLDLEQLRALVETALKLSPLEEVAATADSSMIGDSEVMQRLQQQISKLARSQAPIYISGESGSGKEVVARLIHEQGPRGDHPFVPVNCGAIPGELMESEFFGHVKGSFTGAVSDKEGLFRAAQGGTLFLDEVADLPLDMQVKLLRAIQEKAVRPVGGQQEIPIDVRVLSATHKNLNNAVEAGLFRQDLFYRINVIELCVPALRERVEDIPLFADRILTRLAEEYGSAKPKISREALATLNAYDFPGNVRELENVLERAFTLCENDRIESHDLNLMLSQEPADDFKPEVCDREGDAVSPAVPPPSLAKDINQTLSSEPQTFKLAPGESLEQFLEQIEKRVIVDALEATRWNKTAAAKRLGITFRALRYKLKKLELE